MSHIVTIKTEIRDATAVQSACRRLGLSDPVQGKVRLFSAEVSGLVVRLPDWQYPVVCELNTGQVRFDNYEGRWGRQAELDRFLQAYAIERVRIEARKKGHTLTERPLANGAVKLTIRLSDA